MSANKTDSQILFHRKHLVAYKAEHSIRYSDKEHRQHDVGQIGMYSLQNFHCL